MKPNISSDRLTSLLANVPAKVAEMLQQEPTNKLALLGGAPIRSEPYPPWPVVDHRDIEAVTAVLRNGQWGGSPYPGMQTMLFAEQFATMQGGGEAVPMANGTVTMEVALRAAQIGWGDEVIVPAYTFQATAAAPIAVGAVPVLVDIDPATYCIDPQAVAAAVTEKTKAIIPVHLGAQMADMDAIMSLAARYNLIVIEDCAHAHGARWDGQGAGTIGHFGSFSLQSSKSLTTGEGGILLCRTKALADRAARIINWGHSPVAEKTSPHRLQAEIAKFTNPEPSLVFGTNYRMTELQAALGNVALERFPEQVAQREAAIADLEDSLRQVPGVRLLKRDERQTKRSLYRYIFALEPQFGAEHDEVCLALHCEGIPCWNGYRALHRHHLFQPQLSRLPVPTVFPEAFNFDEMSFPVAERASATEAVWLDESVFRAGRQGIDDVVCAIAKIQANAAALKTAKEELLKTL